MQILQTYPFKILEGKDYPNLVNYRFDMNLSDIESMASIVMQGGTGHLWVKINDKDPVPLRYNTNLLDNINSIKYILYYDYDKQAFLFVEK